MEKKPVILVILDSTRKKNGLYDSLDRAMKSVNKITNLSIRRNKPNPNVILAEVT
jgi:hypothetical protein